ncbi:helix-turn-helix domain-containing protein [Streptosporangium sp. NBC_01756]|uniref:helix-turn-helix domain-containing protein n=1 Tax=Streptosporangium sp. NBC_01756 TaxID=2975950 RepID=UPI002DD91DCF|nr:MerR family transcriptional regulator [Streptosporangium sp. NBC_01756]WSC84934.1 helix-turn-helix domain-containing protein [Streptosporangium sp. NBC_01756]
MEWTIGELAERASAALAPTAQLNGRVTDVPTERVIRWYSTIGLLDPPSARRGRVAVYGRRHLLQLIAVKRRQADGRTIAEIQAELAGAGDQLLESIAGIPAPPVEPAAPRAARPRFWAEPPSTPAQAGPATPGPAAPHADEPTPAAPRPAPPVSPAPAAPRPAAPAPATPRRAPAGPAAPRPPAPRPAAPPHASGTGAPPSVPPAVLVHGVRLATGVTLLLDSGGRTASPEALAEITAASGALLAVLRKHDLAPAEGKSS